ncbi:beta-N-acetylglucosaminidase [Sediminicola sp. YIK13]|uniref:glycoside hydrolase family 3 N-terminal domain-containing protein n=1 Tax=Sediminicola sp. YIK13 TaxID=1453352 RepID=UPI00071F79C6|nr:glycoside hydrolase family 3 N-terminal domain-containing protein [Sediminicola sp. YIK13]ALM06770.1 beta-N-acetylglucosaminidase [Sediminicola sp. YIK13]
MRLKFVFHILFLSFFIGSSVQGQQDPLVSKDSLDQAQWVNDVYQSMTLDEKMGQLFMMSVASDQAKSGTDQIKKMIEEHKIGGVIFSTGGPVRQAKLTNEYQAASKIPLLIGMDAEWGLAMRLDSTYAFPWNMTLGAIKDTSVVAKVGRQIGLHAKRMGVHINFAPDIDININPNNPIIGNRSFGEDRDNVALKGIAFMKGMESAGVLASGKHFPGHGDTATDSHKALPILEFTADRLDSIELYPFKKLINNGLSSVMVAHLSIPSLEKRKEYPSSLSSRIITNLLKDELQFKGLILTDALNMKGVADIKGRSNFKEAGDVELTAFLAGNDILLMPKEVEPAKKKLIEAYEYGVISEKRLATSVKKILKAKYRVGLNNYQPIKMNGLYQDLNSLENDLVYEEAIENALTVVKNDFDLVPFKYLENKKIAYVKFGDADGSVFLTELKKYASVTEVGGNDIKILKRKLEEYNLVIVGFHKSDESPWKSYKFSAKELSWLQEIGEMRSSNLILASFAKPYSLLDVPSIDAIDAILVAYQNSVLAQERAAQLLFGAIPAKGILPVSAHSKLPVGSGIIVKAISRLGYSFPERVGMSSTKLGRVDELVQNGIDSLMYPGAQVLVARRGKVVYNKGFGKPTYDSDQWITTDYLYDLASITKILATLPILMKMEEDGNLDLVDTFDKLVPAYFDSDLKDVTVLKALSHYGRLPAWIAFYLDTLDKERKPSPEFYRNTSMPGFRTKVSDDLFLSDKYQDSIYNRIGRQSLKSNRYRYSDLSYYVFKKFIESVYKKGLDRISNDFLYQPLGADHTGYNPLGWFPKQAIVPSEEDDYYRYGTVQGYVHDMGAAMQGGVGGHAGLFSNSNDVAKIMQMYLQGGYYGGERFMEARTVKKFNTCYFCDQNVRRGVGFDKPEQKNGGPTFDGISRKSFGHSGFTGTFTWADPDEELVYVFLSNRTFPSATNTLLIKSSLRTRIQKAIYDAILN